MWSSATSQVDVPAAGWFDARRAGHPSATSAYSANAFARSTVESSLPPFDEDG
jgi:hypothetical protein